MPSSFQPNNLGTPTRGFEITPDDNATLETAVRGVYVNGAGDLHVLTMEDSDLTYTFEAAGRLTLGIKKVFATGTTIAATIIGEV